VRGKKNGSVAGRECCFKATNIRALFKTLIVNSACWRLIPPRFAEWLIRVLRLRAA